ncbi:hypothetical protein DP120_09600 [Planococcus halotolerans]|uniref:Uncharacterized protein n=1 Tax=Planococcus halotolerans TaxID=2233542 RepID=A0A365KY38_9BACL|nr:hypothetical protein DP120_09600 [Planococcus halotolerans]
MVYPRLRAVYPRLGDIYPRQSDVSPRQNAIYPRQLQNPHFLTLSIKLLLHQACRKKSVAIHKKIGDILNYSENTT